MTTKSSSLGTNIIATVIFLCWIIQISKTSQEFTDEDYSELLLLNENSEDTQSGRLFFGNNGSFSL